MVDINTLLYLAADLPDSVLNHLQTQPELASKQDSHGYSLLHAATSWGHLDLLKTLIREYHVDPNILDEDGETCLFNAESPDVAKELLDLGVKIDIRNHDGQTAAEKLDDEDEQPLVAQFLREAQSGNEDNNSASSSAQPGGSSHASISEEVHAPPPLPNGVQVNIGTMQPDEAGMEPDPEFRRRIEELASRDDFATEQGQRELRSLVTDAVSDLQQEGQGPASRRRIG